MIPIIYDLAEAARILGFSESYLRSKLRDRTFAGMKRAGRWAMTEAQIEEAIESMCIEARPPDPSLALWTFKAQPLRSSTEEPTRCLIRHSPREVA